MDSLEKINLESQLLDIYKHVFIETGFSKRFSEVINTSRRKKDILVIGAHPRNGKSWCVRDLVLNSGRYKSYDGKTYLPIIAIQAPDSKNSNQIVRDMCRCFGKFKLSTIDDMKNWLIDNIPVFGVEQLIIDDAHELNQDHFKFIKWFNDKLILEKNYDISIVFVSIMGNNKITTWQKLSQYQGETWTQQLYERFSVPYQVYGLSPEEVTQVLFDYEGIYTDFMPKIQLIQYSRYIWGWLTNPKLDIHGTGRVAMAHISKLLYESARIACIHNNLSDIPLDLLFHVFKIHLLKKDTVYFNDQETNYKPGKYNKKQIDQSVG